MIPRNCKRLAEVDFPIAIVSKHSARDKLMRHGHPSTLHLWWARRPLAACRAMLMALLLPDPCDPLCPEAFKSGARDVLRAVPGRVGVSDEDLRGALLRFIGDFADWDHAASPTFFNTARSLVRMAYTEETPLVVDPFAGGGSIPLEALRLGCETFASDLNPVACLILKFLLEDIPRRAADLADELRQTGLQIKEMAEKELSKLYPTDTDGERSIAYLWARTARCEAPNCGAEIPLVRSLWLCKKANRKRALRSRILRPANKAPFVEFEVFEPENDKDVPSGFVTGAKATCRACGAVLLPERVRVQLTAERGGGDTVFNSDGTRVGGARILAVVTLRPGESGRRYRQPTNLDYKAVWNAKKQMAAITDEWETQGKHGNSPVPNEQINPIRPSPNARGLSAVTRYGMTNFGDLFTARQKLALVTLTQIIRELPNSDDNSTRIGLAMVLGKLADKASTLCRWKASAEYMAGNTFSRQALTMVWDFCEANPFGGASGGWAEELEWISKVVEAWHGSFIGQTQVSDAAEHPLPDHSAAVWFTDPPYYDAIPYADLSDFFLVWLKRALPNDRILSDPFDPGNPLAPKLRECVWNRGHLYKGLPKDKAFFEEKIRECFEEGRRILQIDGIGSVVFAHQTTEGWEALLGGLTGAGWTITGSWPIATEMAARVRARDNASLATSVHLVCRPRTENRVGDWAEVLRELPARVADWMARLEHEGIRGADLVFACIGPALEIFSRFSRVETPDGRVVALAEYLEKVWEVVGRAALEQVLGTAEAQARNGGAGALEEDARLTALFLWTIKSTAPDDSSTDNETEEDEDTEDDDEQSGGGKKTAKGFSLVFDIVRRFAQPLGIHLEAWEGRIIHTEKGVVRLLAVSERARQLFGEEGAVGLAARNRARTGERSPTRTLPLRGRGTAKGERPRKTRRHCGLRRARWPNSGHDTGSHSCCHAASGQRPGKRASRSTNCRAGTRPRFSPSRQCALGSVSSRL